MDMLFLFSVALNLDEPYAVVPRVRCKEHGTARRNEQRDEVPCTRISEYGILQKKICLVCGKPDLDAVKFHP